VSWPGLTRPSTIVHGPMMASEAVIRSAQPDLGRLIGFPLTDIKVATFYVDFVFIESLTFTLRVKKAFRFTLPGREPSIFDPAVKTHNTAFESANFIFLQGLRCHRAVLTQRLFEIEFTDNAGIQIELGNRDFEPLELIGAEGERHEKLAFYHVL
ncbi:hypothetical protein, partial [Ferrovibrio terrae]|uniref:hypothetical protein n=1 Tax=Ferrovibrio terrae TaxID=2594003 RepID=UPI0031379AE0